MNITELCPNPVFGPWHTKAFGIFGTVMPEIFYLIFVFILKIDYFQEHEIVFIFLNSNLPK